jgi:hypothetical protein
MLAVQRRRTLGLASRHLHCNNQRPPAATTTEICQIGNMTINA